MLPCIRRGQLDIVDRQGNAVSVLRCAHPDCERFTQNVDEAACAGCVMRVPTARLVAPSAGGEKDFGEPTLLEDGTLVYPKTGWEPPRVPDGYRRKEDDPWSFEPLWPACTARELHARKLGCGCVQMTAVCASPASPHAGRFVVLSDCESCPVRLQSSPDVSKQR